MKLNPEKATRPSTACGMLSLRGVTINAAALSIYHWTPAKGGGKEDTIHAEHGTSVGRQARQQGHSMHGRTRPAQAAPTTRTWQRPPDTDQGGGRNHHSTPGFTRTNSTSAHQQRLLQADRHDTDQRTAQESDHRNLRQLPKSPTTSYHQLDVQYGPE